MPKFEKGRKVWILKKYRRGFANHLHRKPKVGWVIDFYEISIGEKEFKGRKNGKFYRYLIVHRDPKMKKTTGEFWEDELDQNNQ